MDIDFDWRLRAACRGTDPEALYVTGAGQHRAKRVCQGCPVRYECLADALDRPVQAGVWGGMTERERRQLLRRYPQIRNWRNALRDVLAG